MLHLLIEYVPAAMGYLVATVTFSVGLALIIARIRRSMIGPPAAKPARGIGSFIDSFE